MASTRKNDYLSELRSLDWDFGGQSGAEGLAGYHWYPARYVPQVPSVLMGYLSEEGDRVLDPFCGSGTTLVEASRLGRPSVGIDTNPVAILMAKAKVVPFVPADWERYTRGLLEKIDQSLIKSANASAWLEQTVPAFEEQRTWYHADTLRELACIFEAIESIPGEYQVVGRAAFSSILRGACSQDKHWGWICDNVKPAELYYKPALRLFSEKLGGYGEVRRSRSAALGVAKGASSSVLEGDCSIVLKDFEDNAFDTVVTSPPYFAMTDYIRSQRLTFLWFGWNLYDLKKAESGARYKRHRKAALEQYLDDMRRSFRQVGRVLRPAGYCCVVIGESPSRKPYLDDFRDMMIDEGFVIEARIRRRVATRRTFAELTHEEIIISRRA